MKQIFITQNKIVLVDDEDYHYLNQFKWHYHPSGYAQRHVGEKKVYMHREIMGFPKCLVDHINGNGLDNRRSNLRECNASQNKMNARLISSNTTGFRGVVWDKNRNKWKSQIKLNQKNINLGRFDTKEEAIKARILAEKELFGEFAQYANQ